MILIKNALIINEGKRQKADVLIDGERIKKIEVQGTGLKVKERPSPFTLHLSPFTFRLDYRRRRFAASPRPHRRPSPFPRTGFDAQRRYSQRIASGCCRWNHLFYGYAEYTASNRNS